MAVSGVKIVASFSEEGLAIQFLSRCCEVNFLPTLAPTSPSSVPISFCHVTDHRVPVGVFIPTVETQLDVDTNVSDVHCKTGLWVDLFYLDSQPAFNLLHWALRWWKISFFAHLITASKYPFLKRFYHWVIAAGSSTFDWRKNARNRLRLQSRCRFRVRLQCYVTFQWNV